MLKLILVLKFKLRGMKRMKLRVLVDNNTISRMHGEWGLTFFIEDTNKKILLDVGSSNLFIENADKMNIDLSKLDYVAISHGHHDHTWGIQYLVRLFFTKAIQKQERPHIVAHPQAFSSKIGQNDTNTWEFGSMISEYELSRNFNLNLSKEPVWLTDNLVFLGEIKRQNDFENKKPIGKIIENDVLKDDYVIDDTALAYKSAKGIVVITGCSHSGICNIIEQAKEVCGDDRIIDVIGGLHLLNPSKEQLEGTLNYMEHIKPKVLHPCHCTDLKSKIALAQVAKVEEVGVGLELEYE